MDELFKSPVIAITVASALAALVLTIVITYIVAFFQGRSISFWPPTLGSKPSKMTINQELPLLPVGDKDRLPEKWVGNWKYTDGTTKPFQQERVFITEQRRAKEGIRIKGYITFDPDPNKKWWIEGIYSGKFLQILYYPSEESSDAWFIDYGCYFFEANNTGQFIGYSVACESDDEEIGLATHTWQKA